MPSWPLCAGWHVPDRRRLLPVFFVVVAVLCLALALTAGPRTTTPPQVRAKVVSSPASASWGPTRDEVALAAAYVDRMSLKQQAGQVIVAKYRGTGAPLRALRTLHLGGVIANSGNIASVKQIRAVNARLAREFARRSYPGFVAVDQEGGLVARVRGTATRWPTFMATGAADRPGLTEEVARANGRELANLGFTVDLAPVADVTTGSGDPTIGTRSAGGRPALVARHVVAYAAGLQSAGILPVVKHFPGHGSVGTDSHRALPVQNRSRATLVASDLVPFREAVEHGAPAMMTGHIALRSENASVPASLSSALTTGLLRDQLGFGGLVVTDALDMGAVTLRHSPGDASVRALRAGADVLLMPADARRARDGIVHAVRAGDLPRARLVQAAARMIASLLHARSNGVETAPPGAGTKLSLQLSRSAVTSVSGPCSGRLVGKAVRLRGPVLLRKALKRDLRGSGLRYGRGTIVVLVPAGARAPRKAGVVVALDRPGLLARTRARVRLATFGDGPGSVRALADVLLGRDQAPGRLPVTAPGLRRQGC